jgi:hypothetical protein
MRRACALSLAALLLVLAAAPLADAAKARRLPATPPTAPVPPQESVHAAFPRGTDRLVSLGLAGAGLLALALVAAMRARTPRARKPPRRSFEAGRIIGREARALSPEDAVRALQASRAGGEAVAVATEGGAVRVTLRRGRGESCQHAMGYLTGLFESAYATDVQIAHPVCGGKRRGAVCTYEVRPVNRAAARAAGASTRG